MSDLAPGALRRALARRRGAPRNAELARHFELSQDLLCTVDAEGMPLRLNHRWTEVLGWSIADLKSRPVLEIVHPEDRRRVAAVVARAGEGALAHRVLDFECRLATPDGRWRTVAWNGSLTPDGVLHAAGRDITERLDSEQELRLQAEVARNMAEGVLLVRTSDWTIVFANAKLAEIFGYAPGELEGRPVEILTPPPGERKKPVQTSIESSGGFSGQVENLRKDGTRFWCQVNISNFEHPEHGEVSVAVHADITSEKAAREALAAAEERFRRAFEDAGAGMALIGVRGADAGRFLEVNAALTTITGYSHDELMATGLADITHPEELVALRGTTRRLLDGELASFQSEQRLLHVDGRVVWVSLSTSLIRDHEGAPLHRIAHIQDISERKRFESQLRRLADHDPLTGLVNRRRFEEELVRELAVAERYGTAGAVLVIDLDNFKFINDSLGHAAGDALIVRVGQLLRERLRATDVVGRLGGDEFAVLLPQADASEATRVADELLASIRDARAPTVKGARGMSASIGIALFHDEASRGSGEALMMQADIAMYEAKQSGRDQIGAFDPAAGRQAEMRAHLSWADRIRDALDDDAFVVHAQPIVPLGDGGPAVFELLVRLRDEDGALVAPASFLHVAERTNLIVEVDRWMVRRAVALLAEHVGAGCDLHLHVNLSARSMTDPGLGDHVAGALAAAGVDPRRLVLEVTETVAIVNVERARSFASQLHALGCRFALDDFGAGFASFQYLKDLEFAILKIDGGLIQDLPGSSTNQLLVKAIVEMARGLGKETIAEYVEDRATLELLREVGVDHAQGYHLGRPAPIEQHLAATSGDRAA